MQCLNVRLCGAPSLAAVKPRAAVRAAASVAPARRMRVRAAATEEEEMRSPEDSIGMGGMMEDIMKSAAGGSAVPGWVPAIPELESALKLLASDSVVISDKLLVEKYGEALFAATGFTKRAEQINGRLAMIGFVAAVGASFKGDVLVQLSRAPMGVFLIVLLIATATLVPEIDAEAGYIPGNVRQSVEKLMEASKLDQFFTETAEVVNGRAAMMGMAVFLLTATIF